MKSKLLIVEIIALAIASTVTVWAMLRAAAWQIDLAAIALICLAISPYAVLYAASILLAKFTSLPKNTLVSCVTAVLMLAFTLLVYLGAAINSESSTDALIFIFVPIWLYIGGFILMLVGLSASWLLSRLSKSETRTQ